MAEAEHDENNDDEQLANGDVTRELNTSDEPIIDPVEDRKTHAEKNERLQNQLKVSYEIFFFINQVGQNFDT